MKTLSILTLSTLLLFSTACKKRNNCKMYTEDLIQSSHNLETAAYNDIYYHNSETAAKLKQAKQQYEQDLKGQSKYCN